MTRSAWYPVLFVTLLAALVAGLVTSVEVATRARAEAAERERVESRVFAALGIVPPAGAGERSALFAARIREHPGGGAEPPWFALLAADGGAPEGFALPFRGPGFWGPISGYLGVDAKRERILGLAFVRQEETPGLGGRIAEPWFAAQFKGKPARPPEGGGETLSFVFATPGGEREVEAITGATQTSRRLGGFLNAFLAGLGGHPAFAAGEARP